MNTQNTKKLIDTENKIMVAIHEGGWRMSEKVGGIKKYKLPVIKIVTRM